MLELDKVTLRRGHDPRFLNVDYDGTEVGHLEFDADGDIERIHAFPRRPYGPVVQLVARCVRKAAEFQT